MLDVAFTKRQIFDCSIFCREENDKNAGNVVTKIIMIKDGGDQEN